MSDALGALMEKNLVEVFEQRDPARRAAATSRRRKRVAKLQPSSDRTPFELCLATRSPFCGSPLQ